jgi:hypothetical protein
MTPRATDSRVTHDIAEEDARSLTLEDIVETASPAGEEVEDRESHTYDDSIVDSEDYMENDIRVVADSLITANGEVIADVLAGIRDALDKMNKVLYSKLGKH